MLESLVDDDRRLQSPSSSKRNYRCSPAVQALLESGTKCFKNYYLVRWFNGMKNELGMKIDGKDT